ncbi:MAG: hypothetical protein AB4426_32285 [Xenococcaceae cyanobacterium]
MGIYKLLNDIITYITEGFARIFGPNDDEYPAIGVQPFEGEPYQGASDADW